MTRPTGKTEHLSEALANDAQRIVDEAYLQEQILPAHRRVVARAEDIILAWGKTLEHGLDRGLVATGWYRLPPATDESGQEGFVRLKKGYREPGSYHGKPDADTYVVEMRATQPHPIEPNKEIERIETCVFINHPVSVTYGLAWSSVKGISESYAPNTRPGIPEAIDTASDSFYGLECVLDFITSAAYEERAALAGKAATGQVVF